jgi:hypothetical protein
MRKITMTLAAAVFVLGTMAVTNAQTQGASSLHVQAQKATIISQDRLRRLGPLSPRPALGLRPHALLVRSLLT